MIPIYRAKKIDSDVYIEGFYCNDFIIVDVSIDRDIRIFQINKGYEIDLTTLSIHFPDMLDSQGNKIFASLSEDGKGGDKFLFDNEIFIIWFDNQSLKINATNKDNFECNCHDSLQEWYDFKNNCYDLKVIGIQE